MKVSEHFGLGMNQSELDFVDVELDRDTPLFVDPYALRTRADEWSTRCTHSVAVFFQALLDAIRRREEERARELLGALHEPNETRLGLSRGKPKGSAIGTGLASDILDSLRRSEAVTSGLLSDLSDSELFVDGIGPDRISDLATNVLRIHLIDYTQEQCRLHGIDLHRETPSGPLWNSDALEWGQEYVPLPIVNARKVLLVPKSTVRWKPSLTHKEYYDDFVVNYLRAEELESPSMGLIRVVKKSGRRWVAKKDLKEAYPLSKRFLQTFSEEHPEVLESYKREKSHLEPMSSRDLELTFDEREFAAHLRNALAEIPSGNDAATRYHKFMIGLLEFLFYPNLIFPKKEREINEGRKRIDISYTNHAHDGLFRRFAAATGRAATEILVECKNYTREVANPELDQLAGRFANHRGWLGLLICRRIEKKELFNRRCKDSARDGHGYIIALDDEDIGAILHAIENGDRNAVMGILENRFRNLTD